MFAGGGRHGVRNAIAAALKRCHRSSVLLGHRSNVMSIYLDICQLVYGFLHCVFLFPSTHSLGNNKIGERGAIALSSSIKKTNLQEF